MTKRPISRSQANDTAAGAAPPRPRRARPPKAADAPGAPVQPDTQSARGAATGDEPIDLDPGERPESLDALTSESFPPGAPAAPQPSEQDIRTRAYHRYLERGGGDGNDFQDWLDAERELKQNKP